MKYYHTKVIKSLVTLIVRVTEEDEEGLVSNPPPIRTYFPPPSFHTQSTSSNHYSRRSLAVSTFSIVELLWMQHICCTLLGTPVPYCPLQNQHNCLKNAAKLFTKNHKGSGLKARQCVSWPLYTSEIPFSYGCFQRLTLFQVLFILHCK